MQAEETNPSSNICKPEMKAVSKHDHIYRQISFKEKKSKHYTIHSRLGLRILVISRVSNKKCNRDRQKQMMFSVWEWNGCLFKGVQILLLRLDAMLKIPNFCFLKECSNAFDLHIAIR